MWSSFFPLQISMASTSAFTWNSSGPRTSRKIKLEMPSQTPVLTLLMEIQTKSAPTTTLCVCLVRRESCQYGIYARMRGGKLIYKLTYRSVVHKRRKISSQRQVNRNSVSVPAFSPPLCTQLVLIKQNTQE